MLNHPGKEDPNCARGEVAGVICAKSDSLLAPVSIAAVGVELDFEENPEDCETVRHETRTREECEEVSELQCGPIQVTKYRKEIDQNCTTKTDQSCEVLYTEVPKEKCETAEEEKCFTEYKVVEEQMYKDECHTEVQNICEKEIAVPEEAEVNVPPSPSPDGHLQSTLSPPVSRDTPNQLKSYNSTPTQIGEFVTRKRRDMVTDNNASQALLNHTDGTHSTFPQPLETEKSKEPMTGPLPSGPFNRSRDSPGGEHLDTGGAPVSTTEESTEELPDPLGCRTITTTTCQKLPYKKSTKVPQETCEVVPSVKCRLVLEEVAELSCTPEVYEYCEDFVKEIPYLALEEECKEVIFDECFEVMLSSCLIK